MAHLLSIQEGLTSRTHSSLINFCQDSYKASEAEVQQYKKAMEAWQKNNPLLNQTRVRAATKSKPKTQ